MTNPSAPLPPTHRAVDEAYEIALLKDRVTTLENTAAGPGDGDMQVDTYDPQGVAGDAFDQDNMTDGTVNKNFTATEQTKLAGIEDAADVTDATNVNAAGAVMESDYDANTILVAHTDNTPTAITVAEQTLVGRITGGSIDDLSASAVRTLLALVIGTNVQAWNAELDAVAALSPSNDDIVQRKAGAWVNRTMTQLIADLAALGTTFQPLDSDLTSIAALTTASFGRSVLEVADKVELQTLIGISKGEAAPSGGSDDDIYIQYVVP